MSEQQRQLAYKCWTCGTAHNLRQMLEAESIPECCLETLREIAGEFGKAAMLTLLKSLPKLQEQRDSFNDKVADAMMVSPDPEVRKAAIKWRNARAERKQSDG